MLRRDTPRPWTRWRRSAANRATFRRTVQASILIRQLYLDLEGGFLRRDGEEIGLRPKSFEVLAYLVERDDDDIGDRTFSTRQKVEVARLEVNPLDEAPVPSSSVATILIAAIKAIKAQRLRFRAEDFPENMYFLLG